ncbi:MAG: hypothetical protein GEV06_11800 [Luteitalea sp.]|nr:hypothetical protein [Luteitalea sp.]
MVFPRGRQGPSPQGPSPQGPSPQGPSPPCHPVTDCDSFYRTMFAPSRFRFPFGYRPTSFSGSFRWWYRIVAGGVET